MIPLCFKIGIQMIYEILRSCKSFVRVKFIIILDIFTLAQLCWQTLEKIGVVSSTWSTH